MSQDRPDRSAFKHFHLIPTRWMDNDVYGHVNNVVYYSYFDTLVNRFLIDNKVLDIQNSTEVGLVIETRCQYYAPVTYPDDVYAGLRCGHLGNSSVRYEVAIFRNDEDLASAAGHFVHVYVNRETQKPVRIPEDVRAALTRVI